MTIRILHEDGDLLAVAKPAGRIVIPGRGVEEPSLVDELSAAHGRLWVVHRLDREVSGALVFAKNAETHRALSLAFERRDVEKVYLAIVNGKVPTEGVIDAPLRAFGSGRMAVDPRGKPSVTRYRPIRSAGELTLLEVKPETGRRHQIRAHLYSIGRPIVNDAKYGPPAGEPGRIMLHAIRIAFDDCGQRLSISCPIPPEFAETLRRAEQPS